jgi:hypothetical protein
MNSFSNEYGDKRQLRNVGYKESDFSPSAPPHPTPPPPVLLEIDWKERVVLFKLFILRESC